MKLKMSLKRPFYKVKDFTIHVTKLSDINDFIPELKLSDSDFNKLDNGEAISKYRDKFIVKLVLPDSEDGKYNYFKNKFEE